MVAINDLVKKIPIGEIKFNKSKFSILHPKEKAKAPLIHDPGYKASYLTSARYKNARHWKSPTTQKVLWGTSNDGRP